MMADRLLLAIAKIYLDYTLQFKHLAFASFCAGIISTIESGGMFDAGRSTSTSRSAVRLSGRSSGRLSDVISLDEGRPSGLGGVGVASL